MTIYSGCITSAESVLITQQSKKEFFSILDTQPHRTLIVTISPQARASIAAYYNISAKEVFIIVNKNKMDHSNL